MCSILKIFEVFKVTVVWKTFWGLGWFVQLRDTAEAREIAWCPAICFTSCPGETPAVNARPRSHWPHKNLGWGQWFWGEPPNYSYSIFFPRVKKKPYQCFMVRKIESRPTFFLSSSYLLPLFLEISLATGSSSAAIFQAVDELVFSESELDRDVVRPDDMTFVVRQTSAEFAGGWSSCEV